MAQPIATRQIRANFDGDHHGGSLVVYQAYSDAIADPAPKAQQFAPPFSRTRMTWIKPSFLWLMHRSQWGQKKGQERTLAVRIRRSGFDEALAKAVLTSPDGPVFRDASKWEREFKSAHVHVQWDTERTIRGAPLEFLSIQVGIGRQVIGEYVESWTQSIEDLTPKVAKMRRLLREGKLREAKRHLPTEKPYPVSDALAKRLWMVH